MAKDILKVGSKSIAVNTIEKYFAYKIFIPRGKGAARDSITEYIRYIYISLGSLSELETQLIISRNLGFASDIDNLLLDIKTLNSRTRSFVKYLKGRKESS